MPVATLVARIATRTPAVASAHSRANRRTWLELRGCAGTRGWSSCRTGGSDRIHPSVAASGRYGITRIRDRAPGSGRAAVVRDERGVRDRHPLGEELLDRRGVAADLALGGVGVPERQEVHEAAGVDGPVELRVDRDREDVAGDLL